MPRCGIPCNNVIHTVRHPGTCNLHAIRHIGWKTSLKSIKIRKEHFHLFVRLKVLAHAADSADAERFRTVLEDLEQDHNEEEVGQRFKLDMLIN